MEIFKKIWAVLSALPAFTALFNKAKQTGKLNPIDTLDALSSLSPSTRKVSDVALNAIQNGGGVPEVARAIENIGEIEVLGQRLNTRTITEDLRKAGGICSSIANMLDKMKTQTPQEIVDFGNAATNVSNWKDLANQL